VHRQRDDAPLYLPTNLFVRRDVYAKAGGYCEDFFDPGTRVYFREDSDFGFTLEALGARVVSDPALRVEHPVEHQRFWDPVRWARRHLMDPLLAARHPQRFRDRIEVPRAGAVHRAPADRAAVAGVRGRDVGVRGVVAARAFVLGGELGLVALLTLAMIWAKWRFDPRRLAVLPLVPIMLVVSLVQGRRRADRIMRRAARSG